MDVKRAGATPFTDPGPQGSLRKLPWWVWIGAAVAIFAAAVAGVRLAPSGSTVALWWPAAGISVLFVLRVSRDRFVAAVGMVFFVTFVANLVGGRDPEVALAFGAANAGETVVLAVILGTLASPFRLGGLAQALRFVIGVAAGAVTIGVLAGVIVMVLDGGSFWPTAGFVAASHAAAVSAIAPLGLVPEGASDRTALVEKLVQVLIMTAIVVLVFRPGAHLPLAFMPYLALAWAAFRFPVRFVMVETLIASVAIIGLTLIGGGPFSSDAFEVHTGIALTEAFLVTFAVFAVIISAAQHELRTTARRLDASNKLLSGGLVDARVGLAVAEFTPAGVTIAWSNPAAEGRVSSDDDDRWTGPISVAAIDALESGEPITLTAENERVLTVTADHIFDDNSRFAVQIVDVTDLLAAQRAQLEAQRERQAAHETRVDLERQREDFVATTSHELRTPITSIAGYAELLAESETLSSDERSWVETIERNSQRLIDLIEDLLALSQATTQELPEGLRKNTRCADHIDEVVANLAVLAAQRDIHIAVQADDASIRIIPADLTRILTNLLSNAIKFSPKGSHIALTSQRDAVFGDITMIVSDAGPGMTPSALEHAFDRFYRAPEAERNNIPGTGLGLSIVAELAHRNGGSITLSASPSGGLTATLTFPPPHGPQPTIDTPAEPASVNHPI